jgi:NitT/TauT family transport system permease protein
MAASQIDTPDEGRSLKPAPRPWRARIKGVWEPIVSIIAIIVAWQLAISLFGAPGFLLPTPLGVLERMQKDAGLLLYHSASTTFVTLGAFGVSVLFGLASAVLISQSRTVERFILPLMVFSQVVPKIAVAPILIIALGFSAKAHIIVAFLVCFFPILISTVIGIKSVDAELIDLTRQLRASRLQTLGMVVLPHALPHIFSGLKVAITLAIVGAIVAEWVGSDRGLGYLLLVANGNFDITLVFAVLVVLTLLGVVLYLLLDLAERLLLPWHVSRRISLQQPMQ